MAAFPINLTTAEILLLVITVVPVLVAWTLGLSFSAPENRGAIRVGSTSSADFFEHNPAHDSILRLSRIAPVAELRDLALGLRNVPVVQSAPLLRHFMQSADPELALFAQSILQQGREQLQTTSSLLQNHREQTDPRIVASFLETGLRLASPALAAPGEREARLLQLEKKSADHLAACEHTPRLLAACARVFLAAGHPDRAGLIVSGMPADSAVRHALEPEIRFALNIRQSARSH
jgi:hypothetical protein